MDSWLEDNAGRRTSLTGRCTIGRLPENTIAVTGPRVSRWHVLIHAAPDGAHWLADLGSSNGVLLNGTRLREPAELADGDLLDVGGHAFKFHCRGKGRSRKARDDRFAEFIRRRTERPHDAFAPVEQAALIVTPLGEVKFVSERARELLSAYFPDAPSGNRLPAAVGRWLDRAEKLGPSVQLAPVLGDPMVVPLGDRRLQVRLVEADAAQRIVLLIEEQHVFAPAQLEQLRLTRREAEVLHWLAEGKTNPEIATILGSSPATVKKQVEHILSKLGVDNRNSAMLRVIELRIKS